VRARRSTGANAAPAPSSSRVRTPRRRPRPSCCDRARPCVTNRGSVARSGGLIVEASRSAVPRQVWPCWGSVTGRAVGLARWSRRATRRRWRCGQCQKCGVAIRGIGDRRSGTPSAPLHHGRLGVGSAKSGTDSGRSAVASQSGSWCSARPSLAAAPLGHLSPRSARRARCSAWSCRSTVGPWFAKPAAYVGHRRARVCSLRRRESAAATDGRSRAAQRTASRRASLRGTPMADGAESDYLGELLWRTPSASRARERR
jgi:hypothetical protein